MVIIEQMMLDDWAERYMPEYTDIAYVKFVCYKELAITDGFRMGYCSANWRKNSAGKLTWMVGQIWLDDDHEKCPEYFRDAVLWHEFCHIWDACDKLHVDHCSHFQRKKWRKPGYALADVLLKFIGGVWFD